MGFKARGSLSLEYNNIPGGHVDINIIFLSKTAVKTSSFEPIVTDSIPEKYSPKSKEMVE